MIRSLPHRLTGPLIAAAESGRLPDVLVRFGIRGIVATRSKAEERLGRTASEFASSLSAQPLATYTAAANEQHYEVPSEFFEKVLGSRLKYSCGLFEDGCASLDQAEEAMLRVTCERARLYDGAVILELGCGWGSLTLWMAEHYPASKIVAVSNSNTQREFIEKQCQERGLQNVEVKTANVAHLELDGGRFDRVVSVEMFEHIRNWPKLYARVATWLAPDGLFFKHIFCHREHAYFFEDEGEEDWMARHFFSGGVMPCFELPSCVGDALALEESWKISGEHYAKTAEAWLEKTDSQRSDLLEMGIFEPGLEISPKVALQRWRMFFMACAELFGFEDGNEWFVGHYLLRKTDSPE